MFPGGRLAAGMLEASWPRGPLTGLCCRHFVNRCPSRVGFHLFIIRQAMVSWLSSGRQAASAIARSSILFWTSS